MHLSNERLALAVLAGVLAPAASGQTLVRDINQVPGFPNPDSSPAGLTAAGGFAVFGATTLETGAEPWVSDGTEAGTFLLADVNPGAAAGGPEQFTALGAGGVVFVADDGVHGAELWLTDGTTAGTSLLADVLPGPGSSSIHALTAFQGKAYFFADDGVAGTELWVTDGTAAGTALFQDLTPGGDSSDGAAGMAAAAGTLYLSRLGPVGWELWASDGTPGQAALVAGITASPAAPLHEMTAYGARVVFAADAPGAGVEPWVSDGTAPGTLLLGDVNPGPDGSTPREFTPHGGEVFFNAHGGPGIERELYKTDGTVAGTVLVKNTFTTSVPFPLPGPSHLTSFAGRLHFQANSVGAGVEPWVSDGTTAGTKMLVDLVPGTFGSSPGEFTVLGGLLLFAANVVQSIGTELYVTDGTAAGTVLLKDLAAGSSHSIPQDLVAVGGAVLFHATSPQTGRELWRSDGTSAGTALVKDIHPATATLASTPTDLLALGDRVFFRADDGVHGAELWSSDGTAGGTTLLIDLVAGPDDSFPLELVRLGDGFYFAAATPALGAEPWFSDGTAAETLPIKDIVPGGASSSPGGAVAHGDHVFFAATSGGVGRELWRTDGTAGGTTLVKDIRPGPGDSSPTGLTSAGGFVYFAATTDGAGTELWRSDGTAAGTVQVTDLVAGPASTFPFGPPQIGEHQGLVYFAAPHPVAGVELFRSDGTAAGTWLVRDLLPGAGDSYPSGYASVEHGLVFRAQDANGVFLLWRTDGTALGTTPVVDLAGGSVAHGFHDAGSIALVRITAGGNDTIVGRTDGSAAGTYAIEAIDPTGQGTPASYFWAGVGSGVHASIGADDGVAGIEPWVVADGAAATFRVVDVAPGPAHSHPTEFVRAGGLVFFRADDGVHGRELHAFPVVEMGAWVAEPYGEGCPGTGGLIPAASIGGAATASAPFTFELSDLLPGSTALVLTGIAAGALPMDGGCTLLVQPPFLASAVPTGPTGALSLPVTPQPAWVGARLFVQPIGLDPQGAHLGQAAFGRGLELLFGP